MIFVVWSFCAQLGSPVDPFSMYVQEGIELECLRDVQKRLARWAATYITTDAAPFGAAPAAGAAADDESALLQTEMESRQIDTDDGNGGNGGDNGGADDSNNSGSDTSNNCNNAAELVDCVKRILHTQFTAELAAMEVLKDRLDAYCGRFPSGDEKMYCMRVAAQRALEVVGDIIKMTSEQQQRLLAQQQQTRRPQ